MFIYLAHPIDQTNTNLPATSVLMRAITHLQLAAKEQGHTFYRPAGAFHVPSPTLWERDDMLAIDRVNRNAMFEADAVLAILVHGMPTLGVPSEIEAALAWNRPVCIVTTPDMMACSVQIASWVNRGAKTFPMGADGAVDRIALAASLGSLPDPTQLTTGTYEEPTLKVVKVNDRARMLTRAYAGDAGLDLAVAGDWVVHVDEYRMLPTGIKAAVPDGFWGFITGRSSAWANWQFDIRTAVIDSGYRGELMIGVHNRGSERKEIPSGTRLAQYVLLPAFTGEVVEVDELPAHVRGENGYGSSGQ